MKMSQKLLNAVSIGKNILVYDVAADSGGALSVLHDFYMDVRENGDKSITWTFIVSKPVFEETDNIKVLRYPWIKKSWLHRMVFDSFMAPRIVKEHNFDEIFSLQNLIVHVKGFLQIVYVHQSLPFSDYTFKITKYPLYWIYQNIMGLLIFRSMKTADKVIVQTNWMKEACVSKTGVNEDKIIVIPPIINIMPNKYFVPTKESLSTFFYPAASVLYKNHLMIINACKLLIAHKVTNFKIIFTLTGLENKLSKYIYTESVNNKLPIQFVGHISRSEVFNWYSKSILLFTSIIESLPLPLLEAQKCHAPIIALNTAFGKELLESYDNYCLCSNNDDAMLANIMLAYMNTYDDAHN